LFHTLERRPAAAYVLALIGGAVLVATFDLNQGCRWDVAARCGVSWLNDRFGVAMVAGQFGNLPLFTVTAVAGIAFACAVSMLLARFAGTVAARLDAWGGNSLNLLVVNCVFLHVGNQLLERFVAPRIEADNPLFFAALLAATIVANVTAVHLLDRPLRQMHRVAHALARAIVAIAQAPVAPAWAQRDHRVSQPHE
jgi:hypothetical protein